MRLRLLWMDYMSPIGKWQFGRVLGGGWGTKFLDTTGNRDRIKWYPNFMPENFSMLLLYQKGAEKDAFDGSTDEADVASYYAGITWKGFGQTDLAVWHNRFDDDYSALGSYSNTEIWYAGNYMLGPVKLVGEINYGFGDDGGTAGALSTPSADIDSWGIMADASMQFDAFTIGGLFFWLTGDVDPDGDNKGYIGRNGVGNDWNPFAIATGDYMGLLNGDKNGYLGAVSAVIGIPQDEVTDPDVYSAGNGMNPGAMALAAYAGFQFNEKLSFNAAAGYIWADETWEGIDDAMGFEVDLGLSYKLLDNLTYSATFGYMVPGDMFDDIASSINDAFGDSLGTTGTNNIYLLLHNLTMTF